MNQIARLVALERGPAVPRITDDALRAHLEPVAQHYDVSLDDLIEETKKILAMAPVERDAYEAELRAVAEANGDPWLPPDF